MEQVSTSKQRKIKRKLAVESLSRDRARLLRGPLAEFLKALRPPERLTVSAWADRYRILTSETSAETGPWSTGRVPYMREPMDAISDPATEAVIAVFPSQTSKTDSLILNAIGYFMDRAPASMLWVVPSVQIAQDFFKERLSVMLEACPVLRGKVAEAKSRDSQNTILRKRFSGGFLSLAGANSPGGLSFRPVPILFFDEVDRFAPSAGTEGDPIKLAWARTSTFPNRKRIEVSSPSIKGKSRIEKSYETSSQAEYYVPCPACGKAQVLRFRQLDFQSGNCRCVECCELFAKHQWLDRWDERGAWVHKFPERSTRGFWLSGMYNPWISWETLVIEFKEANRLAKAGDQEQLKVFLNTRLAELWEMRGESLDEDLFRTRREVYPARLPDGVKVLTAAADIQDDRIVYEIAGWGNGRERWAIEYGTLWGDPLSDDLWDRLDKILIEGRWEYYDGEKARVSCAFVDSGGHHTTRVYRYTKRRQNLHIYAIKGFGGEEKELICGHSHTHPIGNVLFNIGVDTAKLAVFARLRVGTPGAGYWHFP